MNSSRYSVGSRVYRGTSSAPTMGTVDPMGYIERENGKMAGLFGNMNDIASQTRSGLAAAALRRQQGMPTGTPLVPVNMDATPGAALSPGAQLASGHITPQLQQGIQHDVGVYNNQLDHNSEMRAAIQRHFPGFTGHVTAQGLGDFAQNAFNPEYMQQHGYSGISNALNIAHQSGTPVEAFQQALTEPQQQHLQAGAHNMAANMPTLSGINKDLLQLLMERMRGHGG